MANCKCLVCIGAKDLSIVVYLLRHIDDCNLLNRLIKFDPATHDQSTDAWYIPDSPFGQIFEKNLFIGDDTIHVITRAQRLWKLEV